MTSIDPSMVPESKQPWVHHISKILNHQLQTDFETFSESIFQVPETTTKQKPEAYEPQMIGLGAIHHFRPHLYKKMEQKKLAVMRRVLQKRNINDFEVVILNNVRKLVPDIRNCYHMFIQDDDDLLAWVFAIDGLFLHDYFYSFNNFIDYENNLFHLPQTSDNYISVPIVECQTDSDNMNELDETESEREEEEETIKVDQQKRLLAQDIMMVENQIPFTILKTIDEALQLRLEHNFPPSIFQSFSKIYSPLALCPPFVIMHIHVEHLLHYMYLLIITDVPPMPRMSMPNALQVAQKMPKDKIVAIYKKVIDTLETFSLSKAYLVPSASRLQDQAGYRFQSLQNWYGITKIYIEGKDFKLPCLTLNNDSVVALRNLVAYETLITTDDFPLIEYVDLMCWLIVNIDDVKLLRDKAIINGELSDKEVVNLFIEMSGSISNIKSRMKSKFEGKMVEVKKVYESTPRVKIQMMLRKLAQLLLVGLKAIGSFVDASWKIVAFMVSIVTVFVLMMQAYCDVYGCNQTKVTLFMENRGLRSGLTGYFHSTS